MTEVEAVRKAWHRIVRWLTENAPAGARALRGPASDQDIATLRAALGFAVPAELEALLRITDGSTAKDTVRALPTGRVVPDPDPDSAILPPGRVLPGCKEIAEERAKWLAFGEPPGGHWRPAWIPVVTDFEGAYYGYALDASGTDPIPVVEFMEAAVAPVHAAPSLSALLDAFADAFERGHWDDWRLVVTHGSLRWTNA